MTTVAPDRPRDARTRVQTPARRIRVAQIVTKFTAGAGGVALRGALALDPERYSTTVFAAEGGALTGRAEAAGLEVVVVPHLALGRRVYPWDDARALRDLTARLGAGNFDLVHTNSAKAGALGRVAARSVGARAVVHTIHGFPFHAFQARPIRGSLITIERALGRITDYFLAAGTVTAADAVRLKIAAPDRIRAIAPPIDAEIPVVTAATRLEARRRLGLPAEAQVIGTAARLDAQKAPLDMVHVFAAGASALRKRLPACRDAIAPDGMVWVSWPKKSSGVATDVTETVVRDTALSLGLVDIKVCAVDDIWSGLKLVIPRDQRTKHSR